MTSLSIPQSPVLQLREEVTRVWNPNSRRPKVALFQLRAQFKATDERTWTEVAILEANVDQHPWPEEPCSRNTGHGPLLRPCSPSITGFLELFVCY